MRIILFLLLSWYTIGNIQAQIKEPVKFKNELKMTSETEAEIVFTASIEKGWHVYSTGLGDDGPISATFNINASNHVETMGKLQPVGKEISIYDKMFEMNVRYFEDTVQFIQKVKFTGNDYFMDGFLEFGACNDESCLPPTQIPFKYGKKAEADLIVAKGKEEAPVNVVEKQSESDLWKPVINELQVLGEEHSQEDKSWLYVFVTGFLGGLLALFTPCVWPIIPMTVSFFLKRNKDKKKGIRDAWTYGASIVVIYVTLGLAITLIFGASALNALSTNAVFNILFFLMLVVFAASFFGAFELTLPSKWSNAVDSKAEATSGLLSIFLMAFTLSLVSFSCTGPIIGFLLVQVSTTGSVIAPAIGMLGFAIALALPFTLFALFPSWLKSMPKSGGWMNVIKVTLGVSLAFAVYMIPGLWGAPLKAVSAFAPPVMTQDFNLYSNEVHPKFKDYEIGMEYARQQGMPVMIDFTGYGCVNCRKMEAAVWTDSKVGGIINDKYVLISLYVDDKTPLNEPINVVENGTERTLRTVGDKWSYLQRVKFGANAQPFYVLLDNDGNPLNKSYAYNEDIPKYMEFLQEGLERYVK